MLSNIDYINQVRKVMGQAPLSTNSKEINSKKSKELKKAELSKDFYKRKYIALLKKEKEKSVKPKNNN